MRSPATTTKRCPKCRSKSFDVTETTETTVTWEVVDGKFDRAGGIEDFGGFVALFGKCLSCNHQWKFRAQQVDEIVEDA